MNEILKRINDKADRGVKYQRKAVGMLGNNKDKMDVYTVLRTFEVESDPGHAVKKILCAGTRGGKDKIQDYEEAITALIRTIEIEEEKINGSTKCSD
tara:strand:+ start:46 stop:336 length:291 start_codon:yes stop_codon:yes gene_type:complete